MLLQILFSIGLVALVFALLGIRMIIKKEGKFPNMHIGSNKGLNARGITCATSMDRAEYSENRPRFDFQKYNEAVDQSISS